MESCDNGYGLIPQPSMENSVGMEERKPNSRESRAVPLSASEIRVEGAGIVQSLRESAGNGYGPNASVSCSFRN